MSSGGTDRIEALKTAWNQVLVERDLDEVVTWPARPPAAVVRAILGHVRAHEEPGRDQRLGHESAPSRRDLTACEHFPTASRNPELTVVRRHMESPGTRARHVPGLSKGVEVAGIEPASSRGEPGLLRAQPTRRSARLPPSRRHVVDKPSSMSFLNRPWN